MTTEIIVKAYCGKEKEVEIVIQDSESKDSESIILQDGEEKDALYVYDKREIFVREVDKS